MIKSNLTAVILFAMIFLGSFAVGDNAGLYFNLLALVIAISGMLGAMFLSYPAKNIAIACGVAWNAYRIELPSHNRIIEMLMDSHRMEEMRDILQTEMYYFKQRRIQHERLIRHAARLAPAYGVAGSVIGLIAMLSGIDDPDVIIKSIPVALTSTLYGIVLSNFFLIPMAENLHSKTRNELLIQKLITDG